MKKLTTLLLTLLMLTALFTGCAPTEPANPDVTPDTTPTVTPTESPSAVPPEGDVGSGDSPPLRVFTSGDEKVLLLPDRLFFAKLSHGTVIYGYFYELTEGDEAAVVFRYNDDSEMEIGGILGDVLTIPAAWDDGHGHDLDYTLSDQTLVFLGEDDQSVTLNADNTYIVDFGSDVVSTGTYSFIGQRVIFAVGEDAATEGRLTIAEADDDDDDDDHHHHGHSHGHDDEDDVCFVIVLEMSHGQFVLQ